MQTPEIKQLKNAIAALRVLLEEGKTRDAQTNLRINELEAALKDSLAKLEHRLHILELGQARHDGAAEVTGKILLQVPGKEEKKEQEKNQTERWKATTTIIVAVVTGIFGTITGLISLLQNLARHH